LDDIYSFQRSHSSRFAGLNLIDQPIGARKATSHCAGRRQRLHRHDL